MAYIILRVPSRQCLELRQLKRYRKLETVGFKIRLSLCFNSSRAFFRDFSKITHESLFAQPSKTPQNDFWCFTHICLPLRQKSLNHAFFKSRQ